MVLLTVNLFLGSAGLTVMVLATFRLHKLLRFTRQSIYQSQKSNYHSEYLSLGLMYLFLAGFLISFFNSLASESGTGYTLIMLIFFLGSIFIHFSVSSQISMTMMLREKNMEIMKTFVNAIDLKDSYTKGHSEHVYELVGLIYDHLPERQRQKINKPKLLDAAMLHDCGKLSIRDDILNKRGRLSPLDWEDIKTHPTYGKKMLDDTCFSDISEWVLYHHERVDGKGYYGLRGEDIPVESRIIAIADTYSALSTDRIYRRRYSHEQTMEIMALSTGTQLDTELMGCFMRISPADLERIRPVDAHVFFSGPDLRDDNSEEKGKSLIRVTSTYYLQ